MNHTHELAIFLAQVILLLTVGRLLSELMQRIGQPQVMGQLLAGLLLGPSVLGALSPDLHHMIFPDNAAQRRMLQGLSELGILDRKSTRLNSSHSSPSRMPSSA